MTTISDAAIAQARSRVQQALDQRKIDEGVLRLIPAPTTPCPSWCSEPTGHHWWTLETAVAEHGDCRAQRSHFATVLDFDGGTIGLFRTDTFAISGFDHEGERAGTATITVEAGNSDGGGLSADQGAQVAAALSEAARLLRAG